DHHRTDGIRCAGIVSSVSDDAGQYVVTAWGDIREAVTSLAVGQGLAYRDLGTVVLGAVCRNGCTSGQRHSSHPNADGWRAFTCSKLSGHDPCWNGGCALKK